MFPIVIEYLICVQRTLGFLYAQGYFFQIKPRWDVHLQIFKKMFSPSPSGAAEHL